MKKRLLIISLIILGMVLSYTFKPLTVYADEVNVPTEEPVNVNNDVPTDDENEYEEKEEEVPPTTVNEEEPIVQQEVDEPVRATATPSDEDIQEETTTEDDIHGGEIYDIQKVKVITTKVDEEGNLLAGAKLQILDANGKVVDEWTSTEEAHETLLPDGEYTLHEVEAPEGYDLAEDKPFTVRVEIADLDAGVEMSEEPCPHYTGTPLYYVEIKGVQHEVYCINQDWETPDDNSQYDGEILDSSHIRDFTQQTVYVNAQKDTEKKDISDQTLNDTELYDKILDIIYHRYKATTAFPDLTEAEIRYVTESALKNYTNAGLTRVQGILKSQAPEGYENVSYYISGNYVFYLQHWYRDFVYYPDAELGQDIFKTEIGKGDAFGTLARHWSGTGADAWGVAGHNAKGDAEVRKQVARYYELYLYLIDDADTHPPDMHLYIYSSGDRVTNEDDQSSYDFDNGAYQNLLGVTGYFEDIKQQELEVEMKNNYSTETTSIKVTKVWEDQDDKEKVRPTKAIVYILADGKQIKEVTLSADNEWTYTIEDLPVYNKGKKIEYSVSEQELKLYEPVITGDMEEGFVITNFYSPKGGENPPTGDNIYLHMGSLIVSISLLIGSIYLKKKNN